MKHGEIQYVAVEGNTLILRGASTPLEEQRFKLTEEASNAIREALDEAMGLSNWNTNTDTPWETHNQRLPCDTSFMG